MGSVQTSDGKFVNVGNFDSDGLNVNNDTRDNHNSNLGVCPARQSRQCNQREAYFFEVGFSCVRRLLPNGSYPAAQHSAYFLDMILADDIAFIAQNLEVC